MAKGAHPWIKMFLHFGGRLGVVFTGFSGDGGADTAAEGATMRIAADLVARDPNGEACGFMIKLDGSFVLT